MTPHLETILLLLLACFLGWELEREKPRAYPLGNGDTLMVRIVGYDFCPEHCSIDHSHYGHFTNYDCDYNYCNHITIDEN